MHYVLIGVYYAFPDSSLYIIQINRYINWTTGLPRSSDGKASACNAGGTGDVGLTLGSGRCAGGGNGNPLQYSCLENSMDKGA